MAKNNLTNYLQKTVVEGKIQPIKEEKQIKEQFSPLKTVEEALAWVKEHRKRGSYVWPYKIPRGAEYLVINNNTAKVYDEINNYNWVDAEGMIETLNDLKAEAESEGRGVNMEDRTWAKKSQYEPQFGAEEE